MEMNEDQIHKIVREGRVGWRVMSAEEMSLAREIGNYKQIAQWIKDHENRVGTHGALHTGEIKAKADQVMVLLQEMVDLMYNRV